MGWNRFQRKTDIFGNRCVVLTRLRVEVNRVVCATMFFEAVSLPCRLYFPNKNLSYRVLRNTWKPEDRPRLKKGDARGLVWSRLFSFGLMRSCSVSLGLLLASFDFVWFHLVLFGLVWSPLVSFGLVWSRLVASRVILRGLVRWWTETAIWDSRLRDNPQLPERDEARSGRTGKGPRETNWMRRNISQSVIPCARSTCGPKPGNLAHFASTGATSSPCLIRMWIGPCWMQPACETPAGRGALPAGAHFHYSASGPHVDWRPCCVADPTSWLRPRPRAIHLSSPRRSACCYPNWPMLA